MRTFLQLVIAGLTNGAIYGLVAVAYCLVHRVSRVINLAIGEFIALGALLPLLLADRWRLPGILGALLALGAVAVVAGAFEFSILGPAVRRGSDTTLLLLLTLALAVAVQGAVLLVFGRDIYSGTPLIPGAPLSVLGIPVGRQNVVILGAALLFATLLAAYFTRTIHGKRMTACAQNRTGAALVGIRVDRFQRLAFVGSCVLAAITGMLLVPVIAFDYLTGFRLALVSLVAAALAGLDRPGRALVAGVGVGVLELLVAGYISSSLQLVIVFTVLLALLLARPTLLQTRTP